MRKSNIELLRIVSMLLVLNLHCNFLSLGYPNASQFNLTPEIVSFRALWQSLAIVAVDSFVLISGYFGIKTNFNRYFKYLFQCFFFAFFVTIALQIFDIVPLNIMATFKGLTNWIYLNWFVVAYLCLMILVSPINRFFDNSSCQEIEKFMAGFSIAIILLGWFLNAESTELDDGYSVLNMVYIYCIGRTIYVYRNLRNSNVLKLRSSLYFLLYICLCLINCLLYIILLQHPVKEMNAFAYHNPLVVFGAICLFLTFLNMKEFTNKLVNLLAGSAFAVYLMHTQYYSLPLFKETVKEIFKECPPPPQFLVIATITFVITVYLLAFAIDILQKWLSKHILGFINRSTYVSNN